MIETYILVGTAFTQDKIDYYIKEWDAISLKNHNKEIEFLSITEPDDALNSYTLKIYALDSGFVEFKVKDVVRIPIGIPIFKGEGKRVIIKDFNIIGIDLAGDIFKDMFGIDPEVFAIQKLEIEFPKF